MQMAVNKLNLVLLTVLVCFSTICIIPTRAHAQEAFQQVETFGDHTLALKSDGTLWAWGRNNYGQLGDGTNNNDRPSPVQIGIETNWVSITAGVYHTLALKSGGTLWAWGDNKYGQLGYTSTETCGVYNCQTYPKQVGQDSNWISITAGYDHSIALKSVGTLWAWGRNNYGQLGDGSYDDRQAPVQIQLQIPFRIDNDWVKITAGGYHTLALKLDGTLWAWGYNFDGQLGDGTDDISRNSPAQIQIPFGIDNDWVKITAGYYHSIALKSDGLRAWGDNFYYQLGDGTDIISRNTPFNISSINDWVKITAGGYHTIALKPDGSIWAWGDNKYGQLGEDTIYPYANSPVQIGDDTDWASVSAGYYHTTGLKSDGTLWAWGRNNYGQLGNGTHDESNSPVPVSGSCTHPARVVGATTEDYYSILRDALSSAVTGENVESRVYSFAGDITYNNTAEITLRAGHDCSYSPVSGTTTINGNMTITHGTVTIVGGTLKLQ